MHELIKEQGWAETFDANQRVDFIYLWHSTLADQIYRILYNRQVIVNRYPNTITMGHKDYLQRIIQLANYVNGKDLDFVPKTFNLPEDYYRLKKHMNTSHQTMIVKTVDGCMSDTIMIVKQLSEIPPKLVDKGIAQTYLDRPLLLKNKKFDMRIYMLICGSTRRGVQVFIHDTGIARFC